MLSRLEVDEEARGPEFGDLVDLLFNGRSKAGVLTPAQPRTETAGHREQSAAEFAAITQKDLNYSLPRLVVTVV